MICTDGSAAVWVLWAIPVIIACVVALVVLIRRMMTSVDEQVDDFVGSGGPPEKPH
jgi:cytochrome c-type biogenesis protein CcmH/NrfF